MVFDDCSRAMHLLCNTPNLTEPDFWQQQSAYIVKAPGIRQGQLRSAAFATLIVIANKLLSRVLLLSTGVRALMHALG